MFDPASDLWRFGVPPLEHDGSVSVVPREGGAVHIRQRQRHRRYRTRGSSGL